MNHVSRIRYIRDQEEHTTRKYIVVMKQITSGNKLLITKKKNESQ